MGKIHLGQESVSLTLPQNAIINKALFWGSYFENLTYAGVTITFDEYTSRVHTRFDGFNFLLKR